MFGFFKKERELAAICDGSVIDITKVPDKVFSQKILGDGFAIIPKSGFFICPAKGTITDVTNTHHAFCLTTDDGLEILIHIGLDTVELKGDGFSPTVKVGQKVNVGDTLLSADLEKIQSRGYNTISMVVITNTDKLKNYRIIEAPEVNSGDAALVYTI